MSNKPKFPAMHLADLGTEVRHEVEKMRAEHNYTFRTVSPTMEEHLFIPYRVLDHGLLRVIDYMGDESSIVQAARVSYGRGTKTLNEDNGLLRYLMRNRHSTPYEMCEVKFHMKLPIFVARQLIRHRTANVNEYSGRYSILANEFYVPEPEQLGIQSASNRQGRGDAISGEESSRVLEILKSEALHDYDVYQELLNDDGEGNPVDASKPMVARELARMGLGLNFYTEWYWKVDVHNLLHFLGLRMDPHAQWEIRQYADRMGYIVSKWLPNVWEAFIDYRFCAAHFSRQELELLQAMVESYIEGDELRKGKTRPEALRDLADRFDIGSKRERKAFWMKLQVLEP